MTLLISDDEIVFLVRSKQPEAYLLLLERMQIKQDRLIHKLLYMHRYCGLDYDDLKIVALQTLLLAIDSYDPRKNIFDAYYHFLLQRELVNELKRFSSDNQNLINTALSLDYEIEDGSLLGDLVGQHDQQLIAMVEDPFYQLLESDDQQLSVKEKAILAYLKLSYSFTEIAKIIGGHYRQISKIAKALLAKHRQ
jgi:DNA-directed RNA polymerase specialized sigma subunit